MYSMAFLFFVVVVVLTTTSTLKITPTQASLITTINTKALRSLIQDVRYQVLPNFISLLNSAGDDTLSVSTQIGSCCNRGDSGAKATVALSNLAINNQTLNDPILTTSSTSSSSSEIATLTFQTRNIDIQSKITSAIAVSLGLGGSGIQCRPGLRVFLKLPQLSFNVDLVRGGGSRSSATDDTDIGSPSYQVSMNALQIDPFELYVTVVDDSSGLCDNVLQPITNVLNQATSLLSTRLTSRFQTLVTNYMQQNLFDTIPVAYDVPIPMNQGELTIGLGLQSLQSTSNGILSVLGTSFASTITNVDWRNSYYYNRALTDTTSVETDVTTAESLFDNNNQLIQMKLSYPPINNFIAAIWHQVWAGLATDADVVNNMEDFCTTTSNATTDTTTPINDPCPFPPIRAAPLTILDSLFLRIFFTGNSDFKYQTVVEPPVLDILSSSSSSNTSTLSDVVLQGRVPSKVVLRGTSTGTSGLFRSLLLGGSNTPTTSGESTLASLDVDIVVDMNLPSYNRDTGIIEWDDNGLSIRIENAVSETRFPLFGNAFTNMATKFINQFIARRLLTPLNNGIRFGLEQIPIRIPSIQNLPIRNANIDFSFPNFQMNFQNSAGVTIASDVNVDVTYPTAVMSSDDQEDTIDTTATIVTLAQEVFTETTDDTIIMFTTVNEEISVTSRVTNNDDGTVTVEQYVNGQWVTV